MKRAMVIILLVLFVLSFTGCTAAEPKGEEFLQQYYFFELDSGEHWSGDSDTTAKHMSAKFESFFTEEEFHVLLVDDYWEAFQIGCLESQINCSEEDIVLEKQEDGSFRYSLTVKMTDKQGNPKGDSKQSGILSFDKSGKISDFSADDMLGFLKDITRPD